MWRREGTRFHPPRPDDCSHPANCTRAAWEETWGFPVTPRLLHSLPSSKYLFSVFRMPGTATRLANLGNQVEVRWWEQNQRLGGSVTTSWAGRNSHVANTQPRGAQSYKVQANPASEVVLHRGDSSKSGFRGSAMGRTGFHLSPLTRPEKEWRVAFSWFRSVVLYLFRIIDSFGNTKTTGFSP